MSKVRIVTDSASDFSSPFPEGVTILPMLVRFGDTEYRDGIDITHYEFYEKLIESDKLPTTSLISPDRFADCFEEIRANGEEMVVITISSELSGTYNSAVIAADDAPDVHVVDSLSAAIGQQILVLRALELANQGKSAKEIVEVLEAEKKEVKILALLDTLEYLKQGGRISPTVAFVGGVMSIKPVITITDGKVEMLGKARGSKNGNNFLINLIREGKGIDFNRPYVLGYTGLNDTLLQKYIEDSKDLWADQTSNLPISTIGATIGTHIGPGGIAVAYFENH